MPQPADEPTSIVLVAEAGVPYDPACSSDPIDEWIGLMEVVEALCPTWTERKPSIGGRFEL